jgi:N6-L-threonylcarbamoyladenine synthase
MILLGIESSCDETSAAVIRMEENKREILSNIVASQIEIHALYGGVVPEIAGRAHIDAVSRITYRALEEAGVTISDIEAIGVTASPGLIGALLVGVNFAKSLAYANNIPLVPVNHIKGHAAAAYFSSNELKPPYLALVVSGGHTSFYKVSSYTDFEEIGSSRDDAAGEAFDKVGRVLGLPYPGGHEFDALASAGTPGTVKLPSPAIPGDNFDFSFSGLKTASINHIHRLTQLSQIIDRNSFAADFTECVCSAIKKKTELAIKHTGATALVCAGGVSANSHLRATLSELCKSLRIPLYLPSLSLCGDNAAMIAAQAYYEYLAGHLADTHLNASPV